MSEDLRKDVLAYAQSNIGQPVGKGTCWDLGEFALAKGTKGKAKTSYDYGDVTPTADYIWGKSIKVNNAKPGDILQFNGHQATVYKVKEVSMTFPDKSWLTYEETSTKTFTRGHHTAIVLKSLHGNVIKVLEQHVKRGGDVVEETVGEGKIFVNDSAPVTTQTQELINITNAWGVKVKGFLSDTKSKAEVDRLVKAYLSRSINATVRTTYWVKAKAGTINAYTPELKKPVESKEPAAPQKPATKKK